MRSLMIFCTDLDQKGSSESIEYLNRIYFCEIKFRVFTIFVIRDRGLAKFSNCPIAKLNSKLFEIFVAKINPIKVGPDLYQTFQTTQNVF